MKCNSVFRGNIMICTSVDTIKKGRIFKFQPYKENAVIIHLKHFGFIDLDSLTGKKLKDSLIFLKGLFCQSKNNIILNQNPNTKNSLWVDTTSLSQYYLSCYDRGKTKVKQLKLNEDKTKHDIEH